MFLGEIHSESVAVVLVTFHEGVECAVPDHGRGVRQQLDDVWDEAGDSHRRCTVAEM